ncbi:MAG TPA: fumarylacetoacetase [Stellaceae bacterium]|nr:fumarylacetoacetase [Stellaceae bacterium]
MSPAMKTDLNETHDPSRCSWVASANAAGADFPVQNLPFGVFSVNGTVPRGGVAIGDQILDLPAAAEVGLFEGVAAVAARAGSGSVLNPLMALDQAHWSALRRRLSDLLTEGAAERSRVEPLLVPMPSATLHLPAAIGDYTDFYAGIHHATNVGRLFRPDNPLLPNYKWMPIAYHGRASSVRPSGVAIRRPNGQRKPATEEVPSFGPSRNLDYELELGIWLGSANRPGESIPIARAARHIFGFGLLNDWSARDLQAWEYQPLGPFLAKNFGTTMSPWIVTTEALAPFRVAQAARPAGDPVPLDYLIDPADQRAGALAIELEVSLLTGGMRARGAEPYRLSRVSTRELYWTVAQMVAHHSSGGCDLHPGDLFGSGTISAPTADGLGSLLELTQGGKQPIALPVDEVRRFLEDGDEVIFRARAEADGHVPIGFGESRARIEPAPAI